MSGMRYVDGVPHVWGRPCTEDSRGGFLIFSKWQCPHCRSNLGGEEGDLICLNGCSLTAPQLMHMQDGLRAAEQRVKAARKEAAG